MARGILPYLKLIRLPNVFSALADIIAGFTISHAFLNSDQPSPFSNFIAPFILLCLASASLYLSGMAFNDIADLKADTRERPDRPIPSGAVTFSGALLCALALMLSGLLFAHFAGHFSRVVAFALALTILLYDFVCKQPVAAALLLPGPLALGACRALNILLGMSATPGIESALLHLNFLNSLWSPILAVGFFGAAITAFSAQEESGKKTSALILGWLFIALSFTSAILVTKHFSPPSSTVSAIFSGLLLGFILRNLIRATATLLRTGTPASARALVLAGLKGYCPLDAALILLFAGPAFAPALSVLFLLLPGAFLRKMLRQLEA